CLGPLGFENAYAVAAPAARAKELNGSLANLGAYADAHRKRTGQRLRIGGDFGVFQRKEWRRLKERYRLRDEDVEPVTIDQTLMDGAVSKGTVDAVIAYTSDGRVKAFGLQLLKAPEQVFPPYDAILLVSPAAARRPGLREALRPLLGAISQETMQEANGRVD